LIWCPKYRRSVLTEEIQKRLLELLYEKASELEIEIVEVNKLSDHVHLFVRTKPIHSPQFVVGQLKGYTSRTLRTGISKA
jgi:putative transposase